MNSTNMATTNDTGGDLLEDYPSNDMESPSDYRVSSNKALKNGNCEMAQPSGSGGKPTAGGLGGLLDVDSTDLAGDAPGTLPGVRNGGRHGDVQKPTQTSTGSQMSRPYVGGFAAFAYEAFREDHYSSMAANGRQAGGIRKPTQPPTGSQMSQPYVGGFSADVDDAARDNQDISMALKEKLKISKSSRPLHWAHPA